MPQPPANRGGRTTLIAFALLCTASILPGARADLLYLDDGSRISGRLGASTLDGYVIATGFAGELTVPAAKVVGIATDAPVMVSAGGEDRVRGRLEYDPDSAEQRLTGTAFGDVTLAPGRLTALWPPGQSAPAVRHAEQAHRAELARIKADNAETVARIEDRLRGFEKPWSARVSLGLNGASGNTDRVQIKGRAEANRKTENERLKLYAAGEMQEQQKVLTEKEIRMGAHLERDFSRRWFWFARQDLEKDAFENLELRSDTVAGLGYFVIREDDHEWKLRGGLGYQFESFENGIDNRQGIVSLGYDYSVDVSDWMRFTHSVTYFPSFEDPAKNYRLESDIGVEIPLGHSDQWALRLGLRNDYDSLPPPGTQSLDTTYGADIVVDFM